MYFTKERDIEYVYFLFTLLKPEQQPHSASRVLYPTRVPYYKNKNVPYYSIVPYLQFKSVGSIHEKLLTHTFIYTTHLFFSQRDQTRMSSSCVKYLGVEKYLSLFQILSKFKEPT